MTDDRIAAAMQADWRAVLDTSAGIRVIKQILAAFPPLAPTFGEDDRATAYAEGKRSAGLTVLQQVQAANPLKATQIIQAMINGDKIYE